VGSLVLVGDAFAIPLLEALERRREENILQSLVVMVSSGAILSDDPASPWYQSSYLANGSIIRDETGKAICEVMLIETTDADGDATWAIMKWWYDDGYGEFDLVTGTGKWKWLRGKGQIFPGPERKDDHIMPKFKFEWRLDPDANAKFDATYKAWLEAEEYTTRAVGYSFHGPHVTESTRHIGNGLTLDSNTQGGPYIFEDFPDSPFYQSKWKSHDTSIYDAKGTYLADVLIMESIDGDGDIAWQYQVWWYDQPPGRNVIFGGTGKWKGITGYAVAPGHVRIRGDDNKMVNVEKSHRMPD
jgi:hypothetical protein